MLDCDGPSWLTTTATAQPCAPRSGSIATSARSATTHGPAILRRALSSAMLTSATRSHGGRAHSYRSVTTAARAADDAHSTGELSSLLVAECLRARDSSGTRPRRPPLYRGGQNHAPSHSAGECSRSRQVCEPCLSSCARPVSAARRPSVITRIRCHRCKWTIVRPRWFMWKRMRGHLSRCLRG